MTKTKVTTTSFGRRAYTNPNRFSFYVRLHERKYQRLAPIQIKLPSDFLAKWDVISSDIHGGAPTVTLMEGTIIFNALYRHETSGSHYEWLSLLEEAEEILGRKTPLCIDEALRERDLWSQSLNLTKRATRAR